LRPGDIGTVVTLNGWVDSRRDLGGVIFIDLRDRYGITQVVFNPQKQEAAHLAAKDLRNEFVISVTGIVEQRPEGTVNPSLPTGQIDVMAKALTILNKAETPPFPVEDRIEASEELRLRYRYLDLRRPEMSRILRLRHRVNRIVRDHMEGQGFIEVETPYLTRSTPEGARDFLVPSRLWRGTFYALPQSPQQLKQLLMVAGQDRYYQIVRCFRDENPRADRGFEFTQLDIEMSFITEEDIFALVEPLMARIVQETHGVQVPTPFPRMTYREMQDRYGSDKPDLRYGMELADLGGVFEGTGFRAFASVLENGGVVKGFAAPGAGQVSRKEHEQLTQIAKGNGAAGLVTFAVLPEGVRSQVEKHVTPEEVRGVLQKTGATEGDLVLVVADRADRANVALDALRRQMAVRLELIPENTWAFCWMVEPPLFEWSDDEGKWVSVHHPFTSPMDPNDLEPETAKARAYDLVLNGFELGGGSIRIHDPEVQRRVFERLGLSPEQTEEQFGHLIRAFRYGVPPHGGVAFGIDRIVMLMAGKEAIRDVTAFPKAQSGQDLLTGAPAEVSDEQLRELGIRVVASPTEPKGS